jgi:hypothetical protein
MAAILISGLFISVSLSFHADGYCPDIHKNAIRRQNLQPPATFFRKKEQLAELKRAAGSESQVKEVESELEQMIQNRDRRIDQMMMRFTEKRSRPDESEAREGPRQHKRRGEGHRGGGRSSRPTRQAR